MNGLDRVIAHWTGGRYQVSAVDRNHYNFIYDGDGNEIAGRHSPEDNISTADNIYGAHTRRLNTGSIGVAVACMHGAQENVTHGSQPMTEEQFDAMCQGIARLCDRYGIPVTRRTVLSHAEVQGTLGVQQRGKWDFTVLPFAPEIRGARACGDEMRRRVQAYMRSHVDDPAGGHDERTAWLQRLLREEGYDILADGWEGPETEGAVRQFERFNGLPETGSLQTRATVDRLRANAEARRPDRSVLLDVAADNRVSKEQAGALIGMVTGNIGPISQIVSAAEEAQSLTERIVAMGPWVAAALCITGVCLFIWYRRGKSRKRAREALLTAGELA